MLLRQTLVAPTPAIPARPPCPAAISEGERLAAHADTGTSAESPLQALRQRGRAERCDWRALLDSLCDADASEARRSA